MDVVKYFTIFLVVWGHVVQQTLPREVLPVQADGIYRLIYTFHMPLFMGISGYFFGKSMLKVKGVRLYIQKKLKKRILGLLVPMFSFGFLVYAIQLAGGRSFSVFGIFQEAHNIWFLGELLINSLVVILIVRCFCNGRFAHDGKYLLAGFVLTCVPKLGYGFSGPFFYLYFLMGYCTSVYLGDEKAAGLKRYGLVGILAFLAIYCVYDNLPWPLGQIQHDWHQFSLWHIGTVAFLKFVLGILGSYGALVLVHRSLPLLHNTWLYRRAGLMGRYTLDIYLIQIVLIEHILGPIYQNWLRISGKNYLHECGTGFEILTTFVISCLILEVIVMLSRLLNQSKLMSKILFYR